MKFVLLAYGERAPMESLTKAQFEALVAKCKVHDDRLKASGHYVSGTSLEWAAKSIRPRGGKPSVTDGPFVETKELVGGLVVIEAADMDEAVKIASLHPAAHLGEDLGTGWGIELRPIADECHQ